MHVQRDKIISLSKGRVYLYASSFTSFTAQRRKELTSFIHCLVDVVRVTEPITFDFLHFPAAHIRKLPRKRLYVQEIAYLLLEYEPIK